MRFSPFPCGLPQPSAGGPPSFASQALDLYKRAMRQTDELQSAYRLLSAIDEFRAEKYPTLEKPPADFLTTMEQFVGAPPSKQAPIRSAPAAKAADAAQQQSPPVLGSVYGSSAAAAPDLLGFDDLSISAPAPAPAPAPAAAPQMARLPPRLRRALQSRCRLCAIV